MADTHGFEVILQAAKEVLVKALKGAWKSAECPVDPGDTGRIPEFLDLPAGLSMGGYNIQDGQVQIPQAELDANFAEDVNGVELILGTQIQTQIANPPVESARLISFHAVLHAKAPVGTLPNSLDVGILLSNADLPRANVWAILDMGHPLEPVLQNLIYDFVHKAYENGGLTPPVDPYIPHMVSQNNVSFAGGSCNTQTIIYDGGSRLIQTSFPDPATLQISIPIYLRVFSITVPVFQLQSPMGIETRLIVNAPFDRGDNFYRARLSEATVTVDANSITAVGNDIAFNNSEAANYTQNKAILSGLVNLDTALATELQSKGAEMAHNIGNFEVPIPSLIEIQNFIADYFYGELTSRSYIGVWTPTASNAQFHVNSVDVKVIDNSLNIALNNMGTGDTGALTRFIPPAMEFSIALSRQTLDARISQSITDSGFDAAHLPKRFHENGKDVDLNSLNVQVTNGSIELSGTVTVIDAILGSIDVDADFTTHVGFHWEPDGALDSNGVQNLKHNLIGSPDVEPSDEVAFWVISVILAVISFGVGGVLLGVVSIIAVFVVRSIIESVGGNLLMDQVNNTLDGITAWPPQLAKIGRVVAVFHDPVDISTTGLLMSGTLNVVSSCETTMVVAARTAGVYTIPAVQNLNLKALNFYSNASYLWDPGDSTGPFAQQQVLHQYLQSGIYIAKHRLRVLDSGGATSRHFAMVRVQNVAPTVYAGPDIEINEGETVTLTAYFEDVEYLDTHQAIWNFGDNQPMAWGSIDESNKAPKAVGNSKVQHAWCDNGEYTVTVQVFDNNGGVGTGSLKVKVKNVPPIVTTPGNIYSYPCTVITLVADFIDPGWCDTHKAWWDFADCTPEKMAKVEETNFAPAAKGTATASHTYQKCGKFAAQCKIVDDDGGIGTGLLIVEVTGIKNPAFNEGFTYSPLGKVANEWQACIGVTDRSAAVGKALLPPAELYYCEKCLVFDGLSSQRIKAVENYFVGICQQVGANPGWEYEVSVMYQLSGQGVARLGIDPDGGSDLFSSSISWVEENKTGSWSNLSVRGICTSEKITIFLGLIGNSDVEACFDSSQLQAIQRFKCPDKPPGEKLQKKCIDFTRLSREKPLPASYRMDGLTIKTLDGHPGRLTSQFPPAHVTVLELRRGIFIEFDQPVSDLSLEFAYYKRLYLDITLTGENAEISGHQNELLSDGKTKLLLAYKGIRRLQILADGEGGLVKICFIK